MKINPLGKPFDMVGMTTAEKGEYLKIDQTTPQTVDNGAPHFDGGLIIKSGQKLIMDGS